MGVCEHHRQIQTHPTIHPADGPFQTSTGGKPHARLNLSRPAADIITSTVCHCFQRLFVSYKIDFPLRSDRGPKVTKLARPLMPCSILYTYFTPSAYLTYRPTIQLRLHPPNPLHSHCSLAETQRIALYVRFRITHHTCSHYTVITSDSQDTNPSTSEISQNRKSPETSR